MKTTLAIGMIAFAVTNYARATVTITDGVDMDSSSTVSSGSNSIAAGAGNTVDNESLAFGFDNIADTSSLAIGYAVEVLSYSIGFGAENWMSGSCYASLIGGESNTMESSADSVALGEYNVVERQIASVALGLYNEFDFPSGTSGTGNILLGSGNVMDGTGAPFSLQNCIMIGVQNESDTYRTWVMGMGNIAQLDTVTLGKFADPVSDASLLIGNGVSTGSGYRSNAIEVLANGNTTLINKAWLAYVAVNTDPEDALDDPTGSGDSGGEALVVDGHTRLRGKVIIEVPQGDISMGPFE